jgi:glycosyltransferase involved in cell wall biosynthesis
MDSKSNHLFEVIVSHPAKQGTVYQVPLAAQRHGIPVKFLTGLYYKPEQFPYSLVRFLPRDRRAAVLRQLEKRRLAELDPESIISIGGPWLEMICRPWALYWLWWKFHDWLTSRWIENFSSPSKQFVFHTFDGYVKRTMNASQLRGWIRILEVTLPLIVDDLVREEFRHLGCMEKYGQVSPIEKEDILEEYQAADYLVAQSRLTVNYLLELGIPPKRIILLPLGIDTNRFRPGPPQNAEQPFRVLFVGQLGIRKGLHHLLEAWKELDLPNAELVLAGSVARNQLGFELLERFKGNYRWLGFLDVQLPKVYQDCDVFVLPSLAEGAALVMHEAMASGLPCVVTANVGCILRDGVEGFVIPVGDIEMLKDRIRRLYLDIELRQRMGVAARARAEQFSWQEYGRRLALMYRLIVSGERESTSTILDMTQF